jgi:phage terminase small subunit
MYAVQKVSRTATSGCASWSAGCASLPWLEDADLPACRAWSELEVLASRACGELRDNGLVNEHGQPRSMIDIYRKLRRTQATIGNSLGMSPAARIAIKANQTKAALDLAGLMARAAAGDSDES